MVDKILYFDKVKFKKLNWSGKWAYFKEMRALLLQSRHFDLVIDMQGLFKSAVLAAISGCSHRIGYCEMREGSGLVSKAICGAHARDHVIERYLDVARYLGGKVEEIRFPMPELAVEWAAVQKKMPSVEGSYVVLAPGARWETKKWPVEYYARLAAEILADGCAVVLAGGPDDVVLWAGDPNADTGRDGSYGTDVPAGVRRFDSALFFLYQRRYGPFVYCRGV